MDQDIQFVAILAAICIGASGKTPEVGVAEARAILAAAKASQPKDEEKD